MLRCRACGAENQAGNRFCGQCGKSLMSVCPACGGALQSGMRFCGHCGAPLAGRHPSPPNAASPSVAPSPAARTGSAGELRWVSVLFVDLVGHTTWSESRDAEDVREMLSGYFAVARAVVARYGGVLEKFIGDAVMAVWGAPVAHDDDAERAVRAALDLVGAVAEYGAGIDLTGLQARAGVVTGRAAAWQSPGEGLVAGDRVNTAARIQSLADTVLRELAFQPGDRPRRLVVDIQ